MTLRAILLAHGYLEAARYVRDFDEPRAMRAWEIYDATGKYSDGFGGWFRAPKGRLSRRDW